MDDTRIRRVIACVALGALTACNASSSTETLAPLGPTATPVSGELPSAPPAPIASPSTRPSSPLPSTTPTSIPSAAVTPAATPSPAASAAAIDDASLCTGWTMNAITSGLGVLESVLVDPSGNGVLLSNTGSSLVQRLATNGTVTTVASLNAPGQLVKLSGGHVFLSTGDSTESAELGTANGTFVTLDPATGNAPTYASGLVAPNGVALDAEGNAYTTDTGTTPGTGITRVLASDPAHPQADWANETDSNGIAIDNEKRLLYVDQTFSVSNNIDVLSLDAPQTIKQLVSLTGIGSPVPKGLDDMILDPDGILDVAANLSGEVFRVDPATGYACLLQGGFTLTSSVALETGPPHGLLVVGFDGAVDELVPPVPLPSASTAEPRSMFRVRRRDGGRYREFVSTANSAGYAPVRKRASSHATIRSEAAPSP